VTVINRVPPELMLEAHARARPNRPAPAARGPAVVNVAPALAVAGGGADELVFRGRTYRVPPTPFGEGLRLLEIAARIEALGEFREHGPVTMLAHLQTQMTAAMALCWSLVRPAWYPRFLWRWRRNPFLSADLEEVREILGFFGQRRTRSLARR
jgi:hypothetical protein